MILLAQKSGPMRCSVTKLFNYSTNMENYSAWFPGVHKITSGNDKAHAQVGKSYVESLVLPSGIEELTITVKKVRSNELFITEGDLQPLLPMMTMEFRELTDDSCHFHLKYHSRSLELDERGEMVKQLQANLNERIHVAFSNLRTMTEKDFSTSALT